MSIFVAPSELLGVFTVPEALRAPSHVGKGGIGDHGRYVFSPTRWTYFLSLGTETSPGPLQSPNAGASA